LVVVLGGWAVLSLAVRRPRPHRPMAQSDWLWPAVVLAVMWLPALVLDPVLDTPSNLQRIAHFFITGPRPPPSLGPAIGLGYLATEFRWLPPWVGKSDRINILTFDPIPSSAIWLLVPAVLVALAWWSSRRARRRELRLLVELVAVLLVAS